MSEILFLAHRLPFPPDRGDRIRSSAVLEGLAKLAPVHVGCLADGPEDLIELPRLASLTASHHVALRRKPLVRAGVEALFTNKPVSLTAFHDIGLSAWVSRTLAERPIGAIWVFSGQMGQYVPAEWQGRLIVDLCDVDSAKFEAYACDGKAPRCWIDAREARLLAREEERLTAQADRTLLVSSEEAALLRERLGPGNRVASKVGVLPNGIDTARFDPEAVAPAKPLAIARGPHVVFTGQMDYAPNVAAAVRGATRIMPLVREVVPRAMFHVIGRAPSETVRQLEGVNGTRVWGEVPDMRPFLAAADCALVPLEIARGVQNKVLEAMAMALPVVASPGAATGLGDAAQACMAIADSDEALAQAVIDLLLDRPRARALGAAARAHVAQHCSWPAALGPLAALTGLACPPVRDAA